MILARLFLFVVLALAPTSAMAFTITFDGGNPQPGLDGLASDLGPQTEGPYTYDRVTGVRWEYLDDFGNLASSLISGISLPDQFDTFDIHRTDLGFFQLDSFNFASGTDETLSDTISFLGVNAGVNGGNPFTLCSGINSSSTDFSAPSNTKTDCGHAIIDHLLITVTSLTAPQFIALDNIVLADPGTIPTPEPASLLLLGAGLVGIAARSRKSKA